MTKLFPTDQEKVSQTLRQELSLDRTHKFAITAQKRGGKELLKSMEEVWDLYLTYKEGRDEAAAQQP